MSSLFISPLPLYSLPTCEDTMTSELPSGRGDSGRKGPSALGQSRECSASTTPHCPRSLYNVEFIPAKMIARSSRIYFWTLSVHMCAHTHTQFSTFTAGTSVDPRKEICPEQSCSCVVSSCSALGTHCLKQVDGMGEGQVQHSVEIQKVQSQEGNFWAGCLHPQPCSWGPHPGSWYLGPQCSVSKSQVTHGPLPWTVYSGS